MVLEKDGEDHLGRSCEKRKSFTHSQGGEVYPTNIKKREEKLTGLVTYCVGTAFLKHVTEGKIEGMLEVTGR